MSIGSDSVAITGDMGVARSKGPATDPNAEPTLSDKSAPLATSSLAVAGSTETSGSTTSSSTAASTTPTAAQQPQPSATQPLSQPQPLSPHPCARPVSVSGSGGGTSRVRPASVLITTSLGAALPKPRSNSSLQSSRPAPPSPANSRPPSQILSSPSLSPHVSPRASVGVLGGLALATSSSSSSPPVSSGTATPASTGRDRAASTSSVTATGRRVRPRSTLGRSLLIPSSQEAAELATVSEPASPRLDKDDHRSKPIPENPTEVEQADKPDEKLSPVAALAATLVRRVIVRDYAYPVNDERFLGLGPNRPRSNWCEGEPEPEEPPASEPKSGWGGLSLGLGGWFGRYNREAEPAAAEDSTDYTLESGTTADHTNDSYWSDDEDEDEDEYDSPSGIDPDGLYRAAYAFEPEGVNEMAVEVGDLVDVRGRGGGGDGWVVAIRLDTNQEGLVPEGYLEPVDEDECPDGWEHLRRERAASEEREREREREREKDRAASEDRQQPEEEVLIETTIIESVKIVRN